MKITKRVVDGLTASDRDSYVWDAELKGLGVRCRPGGAKYYVLKYRAGGRSRWYTIGRHGSPWTPDKARNEAKRLLGEVAAGRDPAADRDARKKSRTMAHLGERFLTEYVPHHCKPSTAYEYRRSVELFINPVLGRYNIVDVTRPDVLRLHDGLQDKPYQANRTLGVLSKMFNMAEMWGLTPDGSNPCRHVKRYKETKRNRFLTDAELALLNEALTRAETEVVAAPAAIAAIRLLMFTGARLTEVVSLQWSYVDFGQSVIQLPDSKTGAKQIYLNPLAVELLRSLPRIEGNPYVIPGEKSGAHLVNLQKPWRRIRALAGLDDLRLHDLRHTFASIGAANGLSLPMIGALLGHTQPITTQRYAHLAADPQKAAADLIGQKLQAAMASGAVDRDAASERVNNSD